MSGIHALVRLPMMQRLRDSRAGLNTAGFVSGYRGSPLGGVDQNMWKAAKYLKAHHVEFQPGINEDLAATAVWGTQQVNLFPGARYDGVFGMWYGKGPGVDRCGDVFKHANAAGTSPHGGVLVVAGDDHPAKSSTLPHQSDHILKACMIPALFPASVQEVLDYGLHGWAMSRYAGVWVGMKCITDIVEVSASVDVDVERVKILLPEDFQLPPDGLNIRIPDTPLQQEARLLDYKLYAALAYARQPAQPRALARARQPGALRHHDVGQGLSGHLSGAGGPGPVARGLPAHRPAAVQGGHGVAAGIHRHAALRRRAGRDPGGGGKAPGAGIPAQGRAVRLDRQRQEDPARGRQIRRQGRRRVGGAAGQLAVARALRVLARHGGQGHRLAAAALCTAEDVRAGIQARLDAIAAREQRWRARAWSRSASPGSVQAVRTIRPPACPRARAAWPASAATTW